MECKFVPKACLPNEAGEPPKVSGHVMLRRPGFEERLSIAESLGVDETKLMGSDGISNISIKQLRGMIKVAKDFYISVELVKLSGEKIESYEQMDCDPELGSIQTEVAISLLGGLGPSKN